jgi:hypothetical protein
VKAPSAVHRHHVFIVVDQIGVGVPLDRRGDLKERVGHEEVVVIEQGWKRTRGQPRRRIRVLRDAEIALEVGDAHARIARGVLLQDLTYAGSIGRALG